MIEPTRGLSALQLGDLWEYRELLYFLVWRDVKVRYKQTVLGALWAILQPFLTMVVFTLLFNRIARISSADLPYPLFSYAGLLVWTFFSQSLSQSSGSLVGSANLIKKVYFPRLVIPASAVLAALVDFVVAAPMVAVLMAYYGVAPNPALVALPVFLLLAMAAALGAGLWLAALNVEYRDVRYAIPFVVQLWLFLTPVIYPADTVIGWLEHKGLPGWLVALNPMTGVVEGFRWALFGAPENPWPLTLVSAVITGILLVTGSLYFHSMERSFADIA